MKLTHFERPQSPRSFEQIRVEKIRETVKLTYFKRPKTHQVLVEKLREIDAFSRTKNPRSFEQ